MTYAARRRAKIAWVNSKEIDQLQKFFDYVQFSPKSIICFARRASRDDGGERRGTCPVGKGYGYGALWRVVNVQHAQARLILLKHA